MTDRIDQIVSELRASSAETDEQAAVVLTNLAELCKYSDPRVGSLLVEFAGDVSLIDLVRIEAFKALEVLDFGEVVKREMAEMTLHVLAVDEDNDVRSYAARSLVGCKSVSGVIDAAAELVLDEEEDEDVRHNAFFVVERSAPAEEALAAVRRIAGSPDFAAGANRVLRRWKGVQ